jgi:hypothetical protein
LRFSWARISLLKFLNAALKYSTDLPGFLGLAAIEGNGFGVLADAHQAEAKIGLAFAAGNS